MDYINAAILGVIEGITEFLPISSTGHLIIAEQWLGHRSDMFNIVIQAGAILAVTIIYWRRLLDLVLGWRQPENRDYAAKLIVAFLITAILGLVVKKLGFELPETATPIAWALIIGGIWMIFAEWAAARRPPHKEITWLVAILVGIAQIVAGIFPGTSRSGATIFVAVFNSQGGVLSPRRSRPLSVNQMFFVVGCQVKPTVFLIPLANISKPVPSALRRVIDA